MARRGDRGQSAIVADIRPAIAPAIGVDDLAIAPDGGNADPVAVTRHRREIAEHDDDVARAPSAAQPADHALLAIGEIDPLEAMRIAVAFMQRCDRAIHAIQVGDQPLHPEMHRISQRAPVERRIVIPLGGLAELSAHEQELLPRKRPHHSEQEAQVGKLLPAIARHLAEQRALAVHHFVVRKRQHEVFRERVDGAERQLVVMMTTMYRIALHVLQRVMHPSHVPLEVEAEPAFGDRS